MGGGEPLIAARWRGTSSSTQRPCITQVGSHMGPVLLPPPVCLGARLVRLTCDFAAPEPADLQHGDGTRSTGQVEGGG